MHSSDHLGEGARDVLADLSGETGLEPAREALEALAEALGEDGAGPPPDPGLPEDYSVLGILGSGGGGVVYRALQVSLEREVAVKVLHPGGDAQGTERLLVEARQLANLRHPAIIAVHEVGRARGGVYMTLDLAKGGSLQGLLQAGAMNPAQAARLVRQAAEGIAFTHSRGVVHLDLKPGNVLLDEAGNARVADFGLAREMDRLSLSNSGTGAGLLGTPAYMAPEQAINRRADLGERTDVYGLGALLYACVTGAPPCERGNLADTLAAVRFEEPEPLNRRVPGTPPDLAAIAAKALAKAPADRYPSVSSMVQDLARFEAGEPVEARLPGVLARVLGSLRRNGRDIAVGLLAAAVGGLAVLPGVTRENLEGEQWLVAAEELMAVGEGQAALGFLDRMQDQTELSAGQRRRAELLGVRAQLDVDQLEVAAGATANPSQPAQQTVDWSEFEELLGKDVLWGLRHRADTDLARELRWREMLEDLGARWSALNEDQRERSLELASQAPHWNWQEGFAGWLDPAPSNAHELMDALVRGERALPPSTGMELLLDVFVIDRSGRAEWVAQERGRVAGGQRIRFEGRAHTNIPIPRDRAGVDLLGTSPPGTPRMKPGDLWYEVQGELVASAAGPYWKIFDRESVLKVGHQDGSWFLKMATNGLIAGGAALLEVHTYEWDGGDGATIMILGEAWEAGQVPNELGRRDLEDWRVRLEAGLSADLAGLKLDDSYSQRSPGRRATLVDRVLSLAVLGGDLSRDALGRLAQRFPSSELGLLSDGFFPRGAFARTTTASADLGLWIGLAAKGKSALPGELLSALPRPGSASSQTGKGLGLLAWLNMTYLVIGLLNLVLWLYLPADSAKRLKSLSATLPLTVMCLDRTVLPQLGSWPMDGIGLVLLAACCFGLAPWAGRWARVCAWLFLAAALQEFAALILVSSWPKVPMALAFAGFAGLRKGLKNASDSRPGLDWLQVGTLALFLPLVALLMWGGLPSEWAPWIYAVQASWTFLLFLSVAIAAYSRSNAGSALAPLSVRCGDRLTRAEIQTAPLGNSVGFKVGEVPRKRGSASLP